MTKHGKIKAVWRIHLSHGEMGNECFIGKQERMDWILRNYENRIIKTTERFESSFLVRVIRDGLVTMIPVLMIGAFSLILKTFPVGAYQDFIQSFAGGFLYKIFHIVYMGTFSVMSLYMTVSFSISYFSAKAPDKMVSIWGVLSSLISFLIFDGIVADPFQIKNLGATAVSLAMFCAIFFSALYDKISARIQIIQRSYSYGADSRLNSAIGAIVPSAGTIMTAALISFLVTLTGKNTVFELLSENLIHLFEQGGTLFVKGLGFVFVSSVLWCFGIHGSDCLEGVSNEFFVPLLEQNMANAAGTGPLNILCKPFFDCFILMGGCGSGLCLLIAILLVSRDKGVRDIAKTAAFPMIFNINELMVFGLPTVFNPILFIPFVTVPVLQYLIGYFATYTGLVPAICTSVEWTTPIIIGGYVATGSVAGSILQLVNVFVGVSIYIPFVKMMERSRRDREQAYREELIQWYKENEAGLKGCSLTETRGVYGEICKSIILEMKQAITERAYALYYQPQYNYDGDCIGVEAVLRWPTVQYLSLYPPLLIQLADESGDLERLEMGILDLAISERERIFEKYGNGIKISVNVTGQTIQKVSYWEYLKKQYRENAVSSGTLCIEVTEKAAVNFDDTMIRRFRECREMGILFAIDDFSAGQTSVNYLKEGIFDIIKLDGSLIRGLKTNNRCRDIISSIIILANSLDVTIVAEYVETEEIRQTLHAVGCNCYQGFLYSAAVPLDQDSTAG